MKRVMIVGGPGSGKSTLAVMLGDRTGLPVYHMDHLHWMPNWQERPKADKVRMAHEIENLNAWIFEGGMSSTYDSRARRADTLIWLDLPVSLRLWRVLRRSIRYRGQARPDIASGCVERFDAETFAFWRWIWATRNSHRIKLRRLREDHAHLAVYHLRSPRAVRAFVRTLT